MTLSYSEAVCHELKAGKSFIVYTTNFNLISISVNLCIIKTVNVLTVAMDEVCLETLIEDCQRFQHHMHTHT